MSNNIHDFWVFKKHRLTPHNNQLQAFDWLQENQDKKHLILEMPVGSGKSAIGLTFSRYLSNTGIGSSYILTPQLILQQQYEQAFNDKEFNVASLYGKNNYQCHKTPSMTCDIGSLTKPVCDRCPFKRAKYLAQTSANTILNYKLALTTFNYTDIFDSKRRLMVLDECHTLEEHLIDFNSISLTQAYALKYGFKWESHDDIPTALEYISTTYKKHLNTRLDELLNQVQPILDKAKQPSKNELAILKEYSNLMQYVDELYLLLLMKPKQITEEYVLVNSATEMAFKPLYGRNTFNNILEPKAEQFLYMSSTILNLEGFCNDIGINPDDAAMLSLDSEFDKEKRPVFYIPSCKMNYKWLDDSNIKNRNQLLANMLKILNEFHPQQTGIIHTANFQIAEWLVEELRHKIEHNIHHHNPDSDYSRNEAIKNFIEDDQPSILISPSSTEGLDLKGSLGEFAIIAKVPFGYLGDQWIKKRMEISKEWYQRQAIKGVIQGGGRVVRSKNDSSPTYILDGSWGYLYQLTNDKIPKWWKDAYYVVN